MIDAITRQLIDKEKHCPAICENCKNQCKLYRQWLTGDWFYEKPKEKQITDVSDAEQY